MKKRIATVRRKTRETDITVILNIDGEGKAKIRTDIGVLDHMLELFAFHGFFDLEIKAKGDFKIDAHHTNEDVGIVLGEAFKKALGGKKGIRRFGFAQVTMEEVLANVVLDINGRGFLIFPKISISQEGYELQDAAHFLESFAKHLGVNLNVKVDSPSSDLHTTLEPVFKALGLALDQATSLDPRRKGVPSTKGVID
jgi:imidazoleglycerol-phosphate dehydratase